jgi:hypothetical protein
MLFESTRACSNSVWLIGVPCWREHRALTLIICSRNYQLVPTSNEFISVPNASADAIRNLLQLPTDPGLSLALTPVQSLAVADEIRLGRCRSKELHLMLGDTSSSEATEAVTAIASAIRKDCNLESLRLRIMDGITDEAGVALAEALTINKTMRKIALSSQF